MKTCYTKRVPFGVHVMNLIRNTILILILLVPLTLYATSEMNADSDEEVDVIKPTSEDFVSDELNGEVSQLQEKSIKEKIQDVFGSNWRVAYAIMMAESHEKPNAINYNSDRSKSIDRGLFQINSYWHPDVSIECAFDIDCNIKEAYRISKGGTNWTPWVTYKKGIYKKYL